MKIVLAGGSGQVGTVLARHFTAQRHQVVVVARALRPAPWRTVAWDGETLDAWVAEVDGADAVINLAGKTINCRYTTKNRAEILHSRIRSTELISHAIERAARPPAVWLNASAAGIYRHSQEAWDESATSFGFDDPSVPETWRFAADVCRQWEDAFFSSSAPVRKVALRTTMVLSPDRGGVFDVLMGLVKKGLGGRQGDGRQFASWMHDMDYAKAISLLIDDASISGPVNLGTPEPPTNEAFMSALREAAGVGFGMPAEAWMVKLGAVALRTEPWLVLKSVRVTPGVLERVGFDFQYTDLATAARNLLRRMSVK